MDGIEKRLITIGHAKAYSKGRDEGIAKSVVKLIETMNWSFEKACCAVGLNPINKDDIKVIRLAFALTEGTCLRPVVHQAI